MRYIPDASLLKFISWASLIGVRWGGKVYVAEGTRGRGLFAAHPISAYDFVIIVPLSATFNILTFERDRSFPLRVTPKDFGNILPWWPDLDWGTFCLLAWLAQGCFSNSSHAIPYLEMLPGAQPHSTSQTDSAVNDFYVLRKVAEQAMRSQQYRQVISEIIQHFPTSVSMEMFSQKFIWLYTMIRSRSIPLWSRQGFGHSVLANSIYVSDADAGQGDICALVPMIDLANHSHVPNALIGFPDETTSEFLKKEVRLDSSELIVLQATKNISRGEEILVDYSAMHNFDDDLFKVWYGTERIDERHEGDSRKRRKKVTAKGRTPSTKLHNHETQSCFYHVEIKEEDIWPSDIDTDMTS